MRPAARGVRTVLLGSYLLVISVVAGLGFLTVRYLTPQLFDRRMQGAGTGGGRGGRAGNPFADETAVSDSLDRSLTIAAAIAAVAGVLVAVTVAWFVVRALLRRLSDVQRVTARLAAGDHHARVSVPSEPELAELATSINSLGESLAATDRKRARLISDLAHELRNPLTTIQGSMEGLIDGVVPATPDTFASVAEEADRLRRLTIDLSELARGQEDALELDASTVDVGEVVSATVDSLRPQFAGKGVDIDVDVPSAATVIGDRDRLVQVLTNVIGNALTHTPAQGAVNVVATRAEKAVMVSVTDTGSGIPPDQLDTVFDRYTRLDHGQAGTGIGLNIARTVVAAHGGTITADSAGPGTGSTFTIELPGVSAGHLS